MSQGVLNGKISKHVNDKEKLKQIMHGKTKEEIRQARVHLKMILWLKSRGK